MVQAKFHLGAISIDSPLSPRPQQSRHFNSLSKRVHIINVLSFTDEIVRRASIKIEILIVYLLSLIDPRWRIVGVDSCSLFQKFWLQLHLFVVLDQEKNLGCRIDEVKLLREEPIVFSVCRLKVLLSSLVVDYCGALREIFDLQQASLRVKIYQLLIIVLVNIVYLQFRRCVFATQWDINVACSRERDWSLSDRACICLTFHVTRKLLLLALFNLYLDLLSVD